MAAVPRGRAADRAGEEAGRVPPLTRFGVRALSILAEYEMVGMVTGGWRGARCDTFYRPRRDRHHGCFRRSLGDERLPVVVRVSPAKLLLALFRRRAQNDSRWRCPLRLLSVILTLLVVTLIAVLPVQAQQGLTNTDIIKMQSAGLSESIILSSVNTQPAAYDTSTDGLLALKKAGVSDAVLAAMISRNAAMKSGVGAPSGTNLPSAAPAGPPPGVDEVGVYYQDKNKAWHPIPSEIVNTKSGGLLKSIATDGIVKGDTNGHIKGAESPTKLTTGLNVLIFMPETYSANDYILVKLHQNSNNREFRAMTGGVFHSSGGATKDTVGFGSRKLAPHVYELTFAAPLTPGQYGIIPPGATTTSNLAAGGKIYSFSITE